VIDEERFPGRQGRLLFAYLVAEQGRAVPRDELAEAIWGEEPPTTWDKALTVVASKLRSLLAETGFDGAGALTGAFGCYRLTVPEGTWVDVIAATSAAREAEEALARGDVDQAKAGASLAARLVHEPFLPGEAGEWVQGKRRQLADVRGRALNTLAEACLRSGDAPEAAKWAEQAIVLAPFRETGYRRLMEAHVVAGDRAEGLRVYERCRRLLAEELGAYPSPETESIYRELLGVPSREARADATEAAPVAVLEREPEVEATPDARPRPTPRRGWVPIAIGATLLLAAAVAVTVEVAGRAGSGLVSAAPDSAALIDAGSNRLVADIPLGNGPTSIAAGDGAVWATDEQQSSVLRIDPGSKTVQRIPVDGDPSGIAVGADAVWVTDSLDGTLLRIDPATNRTVPIPAFVGVTPNAIVFARGALWVTSADDESLTEIDPVSGHVLKRISTGALGRGVAVGGGAVWVTDESSRSVVRIDPERGRVVQTVTVGNGPTGVAFGAGSVWVANSLDGTVTRIDAKTNRVTATTDVGGDPDAIAADTDAVWVSSELTRSIVRLDAVTGEVSKRLLLGNRPKGLVVARNQLWAAVQPAGAGHRGGRLVIDVPWRAYSIDPSFMNWTGTMAALSSTYEGLVDNARVGGSEGTQLVPDLATTLPVITGGETTYAFQLRRGIRYSNGMPVRASDFLRAFERPVRGGAPAADTFPPLVGAAACKRRPLHCDLSEGVSTDDATGTIVFHLSRPDPSFVGSLVGWAPIPPGTPNRDLGRRPVPSTGPYEIESYIPNRSLTLVRNPSFRVWSRVAQPNGFPDEIGLRLSVDASAGVTSVERGQADLAVVDRANSRPEELEARYPSQLHVHPEQATVFLFLNTRLRPFDDVRVRRAVNLAVDRAAVAGSEGGPQLARVTCQLRPPGVVGFRRYCPYTADPDRAGEWKAPDLARARRLVAASGTAGMKVTVWTSPGFWMPAARGAVSTLERLGYRARLRVVPGALNAYLAKTGDVKTHGVQAGLLGYFGLGEGASDLGLMCSSIRPGTQNLNPSFFCDRRIDAEIARAQKLQVTDPDAAVGAWARIENQLVDRAPWVPLFTPASADLVSKRVGNYEYSTAWGPLLDQLWIR
jgi:peptide/nickel transport system substrate-binding protein